MATEQRPEPGPAELAFIRIAGGSGFKALTAPFCAAVRATEGLSAENMADVLGAWATAGMEDPGDSRRAWEAIGPTGQTAMNIAIDGLIDKRRADLAAEDAILVDLKARGEVDPE